MGIFWRQANRHGAIVTLIGSNAIGACGGFSGGLSVFTNRHTRPCDLILAGSVLVHAIASLCTAVPTSDRLERTTRRNEAWRRNSQHLKNKPRYANFQILSDALLAVTSAVVIWWW